MSRSGPLRTFVRLATVFLACALVVACAANASPAPSATPTAPAIDGLPTDMPTGIGADDTPGPVEFTGTSDDVVAEVTDAGLTCGDAQPAKGFEMRACAQGAGNSRLFVDVYAHPDGELVGVDMTATISGPVDPDTLISFVATGLGGAMGPDAFNTVSDQVEPRLDGSSPAPVWIGTQLRLTVRTSGNSVEVTLLAPDLAAVWGS